MDKKESLKLLVNHTQHFIPVQDLEALNIAIEALKKDTDNEELKRIIKELLRLLNNLIEYTNIPVDGIAYTIMEHAKKCIE